MISKKNRDKIYKQDDFSNFLIQTGYKRGDLLDAVKIIINFNEVLSLDDNNYNTRLWREYVQQKYQTYT